MADAYRSDTTFDYSFFTDQGREGAQTFTDYIQSEYETELAPHVEPLVVSALTAGTAYAEWDETVALEVLGCLASMTRELDDAIATQTVVCRAWGASWSDIGEQLGVTRQSAEQRYGKSAQFDEDDETAALAAQVELLEARLAAFKAEMKLYRLEHGPDATPKHPQPELHRVLDDMVQVATRRRELAAARMRRRRRVQ